MANLTDFLEPQLMKKKETAAKAGSEFKEWRELREVCNAFLRSGIFAGGAFEELSRPEKDIVKREEDLMMEIWCEHRVLPVEMVNSVLGEAFDGEVASYQRRIEPLVRFSALPRTKLGYIKNAAEKLSFAIIPYEYINQDGIVTKYAEEGSEWYAEEIQEGFRNVDELHAAVNRFEEIELYILCPIGFYDPWQEVKDDQTRQKIFGGELASIAMILGMLMPTQKNLYQMSKTNAENIESLNGTMEANFASVKRTLDNMQRQISWLAEIAEEARRHAVEATDTANAALKKAEMVEYMLMCLLDPLVFAVPKGTSLYDMEAEAHLLMCFGADMPIDFFLRRGLVQVDGKGYYDPIVKIYK